MGAIEPSEDELVKVAEDELKERAFLVCLLSLRAAPLGPAQGAVPFLLSTEMLAPSGMTAGLIADLSNSLLLGGPASRSDKNQLNTHAMTKRTKTRVRMTNNPAQRKREDTKKPGVTLSILPA